MSMTTIDLTPAECVGIVGSPSSTGQLVVDLLSNAHRQRLNGKVILVAPEDDEGEREYGLGTITQVTTTNSFHEKSNLRGVIAARGGIGNITGAADVKTATVEIQAAFSASPRGLRPSGGALSSSPSTGERVYIATAQNIRTLAEQATKDLFYMGTMYRQRDIPLPLSAHDFSGARGAEMNAWFGPSGSGKALDVDTPIPTPNGFVRMGDLAVGDQVYDQDGKTCKVMAVYDQPPNRSCFRVKFSDGASLVADAEHLWEVQTSASRASRNALRTRKRKFVTSAMSVDEMRHYALTVDPSKQVTRKEAARIFGMSSSRSGCLDHAFALVPSTLCQSNGLARMVSARVLALTLADYIERGTRNQVHKAALPQVVTTATMIEMMREDRLSVDVAAPIAGVERDFLIAPYVLGAWLGDGTSTSAYITTADAQMISNIETEGFTVTRHENAAQYQHLIKGLHGPLRTNGFFKHKGGRKHIPEEYLFASEDQRRALLAGLMDTNGTVNQTGSVSFTSTRLELAEGVRALAASLGYRVTMTTRIPTLNGKPCARAYKVNFNPDRSVFRLDRKTAVWEKRSRHSPARNDQRYIVSIEPVESRPVRCITVDSERSLYLAGRDFIPTHNTYAATMFMGSQMRHHNMAFLLIDPQGQFSTNSKVARDLPLDVRALASAQGREVRQLSVARQVRLPADPGLFVGLLDSAAFFGASRLLGATVKAKEAREVVEGWLTDAHKSWASEEPEELLDHMLDYLIERVDGDAVMVGKAAKERMSGNLTAAREASTADGIARREMLLRVLSPFLNMFGETGPGGVKRAPMSEIVRELCESTTGFAGNRKPRPLYVLTLADQIVGENGEETEVTRALKQTKTQMVILDTLFSALENRARYIYQSEDNAPANLMVILDEAARFTSDSHRDADQRNMADKMARFFRELRKYAIGFTLILQEPSALHDSIWKQLQNGFRAFASGLVGSDLDKVREQVGASGAMSLYQQLARPSKDNPVYPWMFCGNISPLSVTSAPLFMEAFTSGAKWVEANPWLPGTFNISDIWSGR